MLSFTCQYSHKSHRKSDLWKHILLAWCHCKELHVPHYKRHLVGAQSHRIPVNALPSQDMKLQHQKHRQICCTWKPEWHTCLDDWGIPHSLKHPKGLALQNIPLCSICRCILCFCSSISRCKCEKLSACRYESKHLYCSHISCMEHIPHCMEQTCSDTCPSRTRSPAGQSHSHIPRGSLGSRKAMNTSHCTVCKCSSRIHHIAWNYCCGCKIL